MPAQRSAIVREAASGRIAGLQLRALFGAVILGLAALPITPMPALAAQASELSPAERDAALAQAEELDRQAEALYRSGDAEGAADLLAQLVEIRADILGETHRKTLSSLKTYALVLRELDRAQLAEPLLEEALRISRRERGDESPTTLELFNAYASVLLALGRVDEAVPMLKRTHGPHHETLGMDDPETLFDLNFQAGSLIMMGQIAEAEQMFAQALQQARETLGERHPTTLTLLNNSAGVFLARRQLDQAEPILAEVLRLRREVMGERDPDTLMSLSRYGNVLEALDRAAEAEPLLADALRFSREDRALGEDHPRTLISLNEYAGVLVALRRTEEADGLLAEAQRPYPEQAQQVAVEQDLDMFGAILALMAQGRLEEVEPLAAAALQKSRTELGDRHPQTLMELSNYAALLAGLERFDEAAPLMEEALVLRRAVMGERHPDTLNSLKNYAGVLLQLGRPEDAEPLMADALRLSREVLGERSSGTITSLENYALVLLELGRANEAEPLAAEALAQRRAFEVENTPGALVSMSKYATILMATDSPEKAAPVSRDVAAAYRARAVELLDRGLRGTAQGGRETLDRQFIERLHADALWASLGGSDSVREQLRGEAFTALQLASAGATNRAVAEAAASRFAAGAGAAQQVNERQTLAKEWTAIEAAAVRSLENGDSAKEQRDSLSARLIAIEARIGEIDAQLEQDAPQYSAILKQQAVELSELRAVLGPDEAVLMLVPTERGTHAMAVTRERIDWSRKSWTDDQIASKVAQLRKGLDVTSSGGLPVFDFALAYELYAGLFAPVEQALKDKSRVYTVADGALSRLPLGVLLTEPLKAGTAIMDNPAPRRSEEAVRATMLGGAQAETTKANDPADFRRADWLADRYALVSLPSLQSLFYIRTFGLSSDELAGAGYTGFGDPVLAKHRSASLDGQGARAAGLGSLDAAELLARGGQDPSMMDAAALRALQSLPGTKQELERVSALFGPSDTNLFLGEAMTESAIRSADLANTRILHLATHGLTSEEGGMLGDLAEPGLVFTPPAQSNPADDGYLAASEVLSLDLGRAEWVILSACNTAAPSGERGETGLTGLAQTFFYAGAESLLVSHWPVFDHVAPALTTETLKRSLSGQPKAEAFQAAMQEVRKTNPHPAAWAPFVLVGEGR